MPPQRGQEIDAGAFERREFLRRTGIAGAASLGLWGCARALGYKQALHRGGSQRPAPLTAGEQRTIEAAQNRMLPSSIMSPGAADSNAIMFLEKAIADGHLTADAVGRLRRGAVRLDELAGGPDGFVGAGPKERDKLLHAFQKVEGGAAWLTLVLVSALEAVFSDPVHGGNPGGIAWAWAGIHAPFPRPKRAPDGR